MVNSKGFTMIELLVAGAITAVLMATIGAVLMYTGRFSGQMTQSSAAREGLYTALETIRQDIMQAGTGLAAATEWGGDYADSDTPVGRTQKLALYLDEADKHTNSPRGWDKLYLSYSKYLKPAWPKYGDPPVADDTACGDTDNPDNPNFFCHRAWIREGSTPPAGDSASLVGGVYTNLKLAPYDIGCLIGEGGVITLTPDIDAYSTSWNHAFNLSDAPAATNYYVPGVCYECRDAVTGGPCGTGDDDLGALVRNGAVAGQRTVLFGGDSLARVTNFRVKLLYYDTGAATIETDGDGNPNYRPRSGQDDTFSQDDWNLVRSVEVRIFYQVRGPDGQWSHDKDGNPMELTAVMRAVPRGLVLGQIVLSEQP